MRYSNNKDNITEEMADVFIMLYQMKMIYGISNENLQNIDEHDKHEPSKDTTGVEIVLTITIIMLWMLCTTPLGQMLKEKFYSDITEIFMIQ